MVVTGNLFQTDAWQRAWWETWGLDNRLELLRRWGSGRTGIYRSKYFLKSCFPVRSIEFVGGNYRKFRSTRTEYNTFSSAHETPESAIAELGLLMEKYPWDEAVFNDLNAKSVEVAELLKLARKKNWLIRETAGDTAWQVRTDFSFEAYLKKLGRNTRLRLYNRRSVLESLGELTQSNLYDNGHEPTEFFNLLNDFHRRRWGKPAYDDKALAFNIDFLKNVIHEGGEPQFMALHVGGRLISVLYNVKYRKRIYNLQSGFEEKFHPKLAVGTLHLGYAIEAAFQESDVQSFDMLAGSGKNENYKQRLATEGQPLVSLMLVKNPLMKQLYRLKDKN